MFCITELVSKNCGLKDLGSQQQRQLIRIAVPTCMRSRLLVNFHHPFLAFASLLNHRTEKYDPSVCYLASQTCAKQITTPSHFMSLIPTQIDVNRQRTNYLKEPLIADQPFAGPVLERVIGFTSRYGTNTARFAGTEELTTVHTAAAVVVVQNHETNEQRFMGLHTDHVVSLAVAPDGLSVASAQIGVDACVLVWNVESMCVTRVVRGLFCGAVTRLSFSACSRYLAVSGFEAFKNPGAMNSQATVILDLCNGVQIGKTHRSVPAAARTERPDLVFEDAAGQSKGGEFDEEPTSR
jgi:hypothetical protein